jgi:hypothetical protein
VGSVSQASTDYEAAPYGEDYDEAAALSFARSRLNSASETATETLTEWKTASADWKAKKNTAAVLIADWMRREPLYYPNFAPKRAVLDFLVKKKTDHIGADVTPDTETPKIGSPKVIKASTNTSAGPEPIPTPAYPTRVRSTEPLEGERFPATRTDEIGLDYVYNLNDDDLRYAINEMYARFGMTFKDKSYQANFEGKSWYQPNDEWTPAQIKRAMTARERTNLEVLVGERNSRRVNTNVDG